ncbi:MAG TPA: aminotransferase class III-fold pyridoxal phosphate-dependent enzyme [Micromonosporaceae bacterium]
MADARYRFAANDDLTRRGLGCDARARTRGDIMPDEDGLTIYPRYMSRANGAYLWDVDNNRYVDYLLGYGPVVLGHADPRVTAAAVRELDNGSCIAPLWSPVQVELNELLVSLIPGAEASYLLKTGSDATSTAVRLARIFTGRDRVVRFGYNGWHDWAAGSPAGIPAGTRENTLLFELTEPDSLRQLFATYPDEIACVLTMPFEYEVIPDGLLAELRDIVHRNGALFVLDEMRSGFRMRIGGAQEYFGVTADLVTFSKAMANGHPISAVVGRADVLDCLARTRISSTFYAGPADMAAAMATIAILRDTDAIEYLWHVGAALQDGLRTLIHDGDIEAEVVGYPPAPFLRFTSDDPRRQQALTRRFFIETTRRGVLFHPDHQWFVSASHTIADVEWTLQRCQEAFQALPAALVGRTG